MAKQRTLNEIRQTKEYQRALDIQTKKVLNNRTHPCSESTARKVAEHQLAYQNCTGDVKTLSDQGGKYIVPEKGGNAISVKNPFDHAEVGKVVDQIAEHLEPIVFDTIFELICNEMSTKNVFDSSEYLTEAGLELFEEEFFDFYHENHNKIMHKLLQNLK